MDDSITAGAIVILAFIFGIMIGVGVGADRSQRAIRQQAIERGHAIHDPQTGEWRWVDDTERSERGE